MIFDRESQKVVYVVYQSNKQVSNWRPREIYHPTQLKFNAEKEGIWKDNKCLTVWFFKQISKYNL